MIMWFANLKRKREQKRFEAVLDSAALSVRAVGELSDGEISGIVSALREFRASTYEKIEPSRIERVLKAIWVPPPPRTPGFRYSEEAIDWPPKVETGWLLGMSREFRKSIQSIDRKLQGRILEALGEIVRDPMTPKGDTVKPLSHDMTGLWRYRLGDFRLIYQPIPERNQVLLMSFAPRGSAY